MRMLWNSYRALTSGRWRTLKLLVFLLLAIGQWIVCRKYPDLPAGVIFAILLFGVHMSFDYFTFAGCYQKGSSWSRWMQTSVRGPGVIRKALQFDLITRTGAYLLLLSAAWTAAQLYAEAGQIYLGWHVQIFYILLTVGIELAATNIARHFMIWQYYLIVAAIVYYAYSGIITLFLFLGGRYDLESVMAVPIAAVFLIDAVLLYVTLWQGMYYVRREYRDEE